MPQDLAALLVEGGAVSKADMDRAVARQAEQGGALDTALLELGLVGEGHLLSVLAHASGLPPAPARAYEEIDPRARRVFPAKVAERHRLAPLALDGRELLVVASHPIDAAAIDEIGFMLSLTLVPHVGVEWRVLDLIHRLYGGQLPARMAALADGSRRVPEPEPKGEPGTAAATPEAPPVTATAPSGAAAPPALSPALSIEEAFFAAGEAGTFPVVSAAVTAPIEPVEAAPPSTVPAAPTSPAAPEPGIDDDAASFAEIEPERPRPSGFGGEGDTEPAEPLLAALELAVDAYEELWADKKAEPADSPAPAEPPAEVEAPAAPPTRPGPEAAPQREAAAPGPVAPAEEPREEPEPEPEAAEPPTELDRSAPPRWSIGDARAALGAARHRDEIVLVALRYARDFFEYSALFAVTRDAVVGHDAIGGPEDERARCRATAIYTDDPGIVRTALETRAPYLGPVGRDAVGTSNILDGLWRGSPRTVLLYPILIGDRPVAVLYADNGDAPVSPRRLGDLLLFLSTVGGTFERIIRAQKKRGKRPAPPPPPEPAPAAEPASPGPSPEWMEPPPGDAQPERGDDSSPATATVPEVPRLAEPPRDSAAPPPAPPPEEPAPPPEAAKPEPQPGPEAGPPAGGGTSSVEHAMAVLLGKTDEPGDRASGIVALVLDADPGVAAAAREALASHKAEPAVKPLPERLRRALLSGVGDRPVLAARALGALRDADSIPILIQALEGDAAQAAADALAAITLQRLGTSPQKWLKWWKENRGHSRAEWLFAALTSEELDLRVAASGELRSAAEPPVRYSPDMPAAELDAAARAWWIWWSRQGIRL